MDGAAHLREVFRQAHVYLEGRIDLCMDPGVLYRRVPGSTLQSVGAIYAHAVVTEDYSFGRWRPEGALYAKQEWAAVGLPKDVWLDPSWAAGFAPDPERLRAYAQAVYRASDDALASVAAGELEKVVRITLPERDGTRTELRERDTTELFAIVDNVLLHMSEHTGEIAALLGVQGLHPGF